MSANAFVDNAKVMAKGQITIPKMSVMCLGYQTEIGSPLS